MFLPNDANGDTSVWPYITRVNDRQQTDNWTWSLAAPTLLYTYGGNKIKMLNSVFLMLSVSPTRKTTKELVTITVAHLS